MPPAGDRDVHNPQDRSRRTWQQFDTTPILISAPQWLHRPCNAPRPFYRVGKKPSVKAGLAIYSHKLGQYMSVSLILGIELDFSSSVNWDGFCKSSNSVVAQT